MLAYFPAGREETSAMLRRFGSPKGGYKNALGRHWTRNAREEEAKIKQRVLNDAVVEQLLFPCEKKGEGDSGTLAPWSHGVGRA